MPYDQPDRSRRPGGSRDLHLADHVKMNLLKPYPNSDLALICDLLAILQNFKGSLTPPDLEIFEQAERRLEHARQLPPAKAGGL